MCDASGVAVAGQADYDGPTEGASTALDLGSGALPRSTPQRAEGVDVWVPRVDVRGLRRAAERYEAARVRLQEGMARENELRRRLAEVRGRLAGLEMLEMGVGL